MSVANVPVAQLDRALDSDSKGRTFEPCQARQKTTLRWFFCVLESAAVRQRTCDVLPYSRFRQERTALNGTQAARHAKTEKRSRVHRNTLFAIKRFRHRI